MDNSHNTKNYMTENGDEWVIGGKLTFKGGLMPNQAADSAGTTASLKAAFNALLVKLKNSGLMTGDAFSMTVTKDVTDSEAGHADRSYNTGKISSVAIEENVITITLSDQVKNLKDFDGKNGWGVHKWLGIGISAGITPITELQYNGAALTADDVSEATGCGLSAGYFVRWVAADLVLAKDNSQKSKGTFTLKADGYQETEFTLRIAEPAG